MEQMTYSEYRNLPLLPLVIQWRTSPNFKSQQTKRLLMLRLLYICSWTFMAALCLCIRVQFIQDLWDVSLLISAAGILWICVKQTQFIKKNATHTIVYWKYAQNLKPKKSESYVAPDAILPERGGRLKAAKTSPCLEPGLTNPCCSVILMSLRNTAKRTWTHSDVRGRRAQRKVHTRMQPAAITGSPTEVCYTHVCMLHDAINSFVLFYAEQSTTLTGVCSLSSLLWLGPASTSIWGHVSPPANSNRRVWPYI